MEIFNRTDRNIFDILKACNAEQRSLSYEVLETFGAFIYEISSTVRIKVGSSDTIDVQKRLFQDIVDISYYVQKPEQHEEMLSCLKRLQEAEESSLNNLLRALTTCRDNLQVAEKEVLETKMKENEMTDFVMFLTVVTNLIQGITASNPNDIHLKGLVEKMREDRETFLDKNEKASVSENGVIDVVLPNLWDQIKISLVNSKKACTK